MKHLVTSGCSFSDIINLDGKIWPTFVANSLGYSLHSEGKTSMGNYYIATTIIQKVSELLKNNIPPEQILVGVEWSGVNREDYIYNSEWKNVSFPVYLDFYGFMKKYFNSLFNKNKILNAITDTHERIFFEKYWDPENSLVKSLQNILLVQYFLEKHNIKYFMFYMSDWATGHTSKDSTRVKNLNALVNQDMWLPCEGMFEWCFKDKEKIPLMDYHPSSEQHLEFTEQIILPWLKDNDSF